jgi:hypothetical protein
MTPKLFVAVRRHSLNIELSGPVSYRLPETMPVNWLLKERDRAHR